MTWLKQNEKLLAAFCMLSAISSLTCADLINYNIHMFLVQAQPYPLAGVSGNKSYNASGAIMNCVSQAVIGKEQNNITVAKGEQFVLTCKANRTAGYSLIPEFNKQIISLIDQRFLAPSTQLLGGPGQYVFTFKALNHGSDHLKILTKSVKEQGAIVGQEDYFINVE